MNMVKKKMDAMSCHLELRGEFLLQKISGAERLF